MNLFKIFDATRKQREQIKAWAAKAGMNGEAIISKVESAFETDAEQFAAARWIIKGYDTSTFKQALYICSQKKIDPMGVNPEELVQKNPDIKPKEKPINPDEVLTDKKDEGEGVVTYAARDEDREVLRQIINTHYGKDASPWCLLATDGDGELSEDSPGYWKYYNAYPKRVAFRNGKLLAFSAGSNPNVREWWDRMDRSFPFIPYDGKSWVGKNGNTYSIKNGDVIEKGTRDGKSYLGRLSRSYSIDVEDAERTVSVQGDTLWDGYENSYDIVREDDKYYYVQGDTRFGMSKGQYSKDTLTREGVFETYRLDGSLSAKQTYRDGELNGPFERYCDNKLQERGTFKDGGYDGPFERYYTNGQLALKITYKDDMMFGPYEEYFSNGQLHKKYSESNGHAVGPYEEYYENGQLKIRCGFKNGEYDGPCERYYENGQLAAKYTYKVGDIGEGPFVSYYENGQLKEWGTFKDGGYKDGPCERYYDNGQLKVRCTYKDDERDGSYERYNEDGSLREKGVYKDGKKVE